MNRLSRIERKVLEVERKVEAYKPISGIGTMVSDSPTGMGRPVDSVAAGGGGISGRVPLEPYKDNDGATLRVSITYGTIGGLPLDTLGPVTISATRYFFAKLTVTSGGVPSTLELINQSSLSVTNTDTVKYIYLGQAIVASGAITAVNRVLAGSQGYERCGYTGNYSHTHWLT